MCLHMPIRPHVSQNNPRIPKDPRRGIYVPSTLHTCIPPIYNNPVTSSRSVRRSQPTSSRARGQSSPSGATPSPRETYWTSTTPRKGSGTSARCCTSCPPRTWTLAPNHTRWRWKVRRRGRGRRRERERNARQARPTFGSTTRVGRTSERFGRPGDRGRRGRLLGKKADEELDLQF